jgi:hypothetical protein
MRLGEVSLQWDPDNLTLYYTGEVTDQFFQSEVDDANMAVSLGMYYDSDSPQVCDESCYTVIKGAEFHEVSLVYHPGFPIATIEAYEALQRKQRLGESLQQVKFNEGITDNLTFRNYNDPLRCNACGTQFFSEDHLAKHMKKTGHKKEEVEQEREETDDIKSKVQPDRSYFSQRGMAESLECPDCDVELATKDRLERHQDKAHSNQPSNTWKKDNTWNKYRDKQMKEEDKGEVLQKIVATGNSSKRLFMGHEYPDLDNINKDDLPDDVKKAIEINVMANYEEDADRKGVFHCKRCGGTINDIPKEETGQDKGMLELHLIGHDRDDKNQNQRGNHKERYDDMKKWWEKPIVSNEYIDGGRVWCDVCGGSKSDHMEGHDFKSSQNVYDPRVKESIASEYDMSYYGFDPNTPESPFYPRKNKIVCPKCDRAGVDSRDKSTCSLCKGSGFLKDRSRDLIMDESKAKAVEMPEILYSDIQTEKLLEILVEELDELRAEEPKDYRAIARVRILIIKARNELYPDEDPYKFFRDRKNLPPLPEQFEDQESWNTKEDKDNETRYGQWSGSKDPHDSTVYNKDGGSSGSDTHPSNRTGAMRTSNYKHKHIEDSQSDNWSRGGYGDRREGQITHTWQMFRNQLKPFNPDDMERTFSLWINFAQNQGISYEKANQLWKDQDIESKKGNMVHSWEASWKHCKKCDQMRKFRQSYDHSTGTRVFDHNPDGITSGDPSATLYRINDGDPDPRYMQYCKTCDTPSEDNVSTNYPIANEVIFCDFCNKTFPENNWQKKAQHELDVHGGQQSKLFEGVDDIVSQVKKAQQKRKREKSTSDQLIDELTGTDDVGFDREKSFNFFRDSPNMPDWVKNADLTKAVRINPPTKKKSKKKKR